MNVVEALVGEAFNRLDTNAQKVMQALAVYNRPVTPPPWITCSRRIPQALTAR
jgi:hypothetical protein